MKAIAGLFWVLICAAWALITFIATVKIIIYATFYWHPFKQIILG